MNGVLKIRTTKEFGESTVSKILDLVENASSRKSRSEAFISRFAQRLHPRRLHTRALALAIAAARACGSSLGADPGLDAAGSTAP